MGDFIFIFFFLVVQLIVVKFCSKNNCCSLNHKRNFWLNLSFIFSTICFFFFFFRVSSPPLLLLFAIKSSYISFKSFILPFQKKQANKKEQQGEHKTTGRLSIFKKLFSITAHYIIRIYNANQYFGALVGDRDIMLFFFFWTTAQQCAALWFSATIVVNKHCEQSLARLNFFSKLLNN